MSDMNICVEADIMNYPRFDAEVHETEGGTHYLKTCGAAMIAGTATNLDATRGFLDGFDKELGFCGYLDDAPIEHAEQIVKFAGQLCYLSHGPKRSMNAHAERYLDHLKESGHGSVFEHASFTFLFYGIDRSVTHELVRHRAGMSYSQVSQRYVDGSKLRFVMRPEYQVERIPPELAEDLTWKIKQEADAFERRIDAAKSRYVTNAYNLLASRELKHPMLQGGTSTDARKHINQAARECLPNCTEAPIVVSGNARAWRGFVDQRATPHADVPIRELAIKTLRCLQYVAPLLFGDYEITKQDDGSEVAKTKWVKI